MTLAETISAVPELYEEGDESTARLLLRSGYLDQPQALTVEDAAPRPHHDDDADKAELEKFVQILTAAIPPQPTT